MIVFALLDSFTPEQLARPSSFAQALHWTSCYSSISEHALIWNSSFLFSVSWFSVNYLIRVTRLIILPESISYLLTEYFGPVIVPPFFKLSMAHWGAESMVSFSFVRRTSLFLIPAYVSLSSLDCDILHVTMTCDGDV